MPRLVVNFYETEKPGVAGKRLGRWFEAPAVPRVGEEWICGLRIYVVTRVTWKRHVEHNQPDDITAELLVEPSTDQQIADLEASQQSGEGEGT